MWKGPQSVEGGLERYAQQRGHVLFRTGYVIRSQVKEGGRWRERGREAAQESHTVACK